MVFSKAMFFRTLLISTIGVSGLSQVAFATEYLITMKKKGRSFSGITAKFADEFQLKILDTHAPGNLIKVRINDQDEYDHAEKLDAIMKHEDVQSVTQNFKLQAFSLPNDPKLKEQWALGKINAKSAWGKQTGTKAIRVAVIDTGVDYKHEDLHENIWKNEGEIPDNGVDDDNNGYVDDVYGWDFNQNDNDPMDITSSANPGHGTHCAGIVGAVGNNSTGISGIAQSVSIMPIRFLDANGSGDLMDGIKSIDYAIKNKAHIISASWGAAVPRSAATALIDAVKRASDAGVIFVAAASNDGRNNDSYEVYPAKALFDNTLSVAASSSDDSKPYWSNYGRNTVTIAAPGNDILSTLPSSKYGSLSGTSMATPLVSGLLALLLSESNLRGESLPSGQVLSSILQSTGAKVDIETACDCRIDADAALSALREKKLIVVPAAASIEIDETKQFYAFGAKGNLRYDVSDEEIATIDSRGLLHGKKEGEVLIRIEDSTGRTATSLPIRIGQLDRSQDSTCPIGIDLICSAICFFDPSWYWCEE